MEYTGLAAQGDYDQVVIRGDQHKREFIAFWLKQGHVLAGMNVMIWDVSEPIQRLIRSAAQVDPSRLIDTSIALDPGAQGMTHGFACRAHPLWDAAPKIARTSPAPPTAPVSCAPQ